MGGPYLDGLYGCFRQYSSKIDIEEAIVKRGAQNFDVFAQNKTALKLSRGYAAVHKNTILVLFILSAPTNDKLIVLDLNAEIFERKAGDGDSDSQLRLAELLDVVRRIAFAPAALHAIQRALEFVKAKEERAIEKGQASRHVIAPSSSEHQNSCPRMGGKETTY
jgi:hypothetical protein